MKRRYRSFAVLVLVMGTSGSPVAAQAPASTSPQPAPPVIAPVLGHPSSQAQIPTGASSPGATAANLGPIVATGDSVAYVSAESTGHPAVFIGPTRAPTASWGRSRIIRWAFERTTLRGCLSIL